MKITFLGTGTSQGVPVIGCHCPVCTSPDKKNDRLRTSVLIETAQASVVIDTGPDFRQQMLRAKPERLDAVIFTHAHKDHIAGLDDIRPGGCHDDRETMSAKSPHCLIGGFAILRRRSKAQRLFTARGCLNTLVDVVNERAHANKGWVS